MLKKLVFFKLFLVFVQIYLLFLQIPSKIDIIFINLAKGVFVGVLCLGFLSVSVLYDGRCV